MKHVSLQVAHKILTDCSAVMWDDYNLSFPMLAELTGKEDNQFMLLQYINEHGQTVFTKFAEGDNDIVVIEGSSMFLRDIEGTEIKLTVLVPAMLPA